MNEKLTEIVFILDRSGSMSGLEADTIGGFNSMVEKQRTVEGDCLVSVVLFDSVSSVLYDRVALKDVPKMTANEYSPRGNTALLDAMGGAIHHIRNVHRYAREEDRPSKTLFVITTDGMENSSRHFTAEVVRNMVERQKADHGWEFIFLGANIDAIETARCYGIGRDMAVTHVNDKDGIMACYDSISDFVMEYRANKTIKKDWKRFVEEDIKKRGLI